MVALLLVYLLYLGLYLIVSYAILFHLFRFRVDGDKSGVVIILYIVVSIVIIVGSLFFIRPIT